MCEQRLLDQNALQEGQHAWAIGVAAPSYIAGGKDQAEKGPYRESSKEDMVLQHRAQQQLQVIINVSQAEPSDL